MQDPSLLAPSQPFLYLIKCSFYFSLRKRVICTTRSFRQWFVWLCIMTFPKVCFIKIKYFCWVNLSGTDALMVVSIHLESWYLAATFCEHVAPISTDCSSSNCSSFSLDEDRSLSSPTDCNMYFEWRPNTFYQHMPHSNYSPAQPYVIWNL